MITYPLSWPAGIGTTPNTNSVKLRGISTVGIAPSPFTGQAQAQEWDGELWMADCSFPPMLRPEAEVWLSWLLSLRGRAGTFMFGDPAGRTPQGVATGSPRTVATNAARSKGLVCSGWTPSITGILKAGDYLQIRRNKLTFPDDFTNAAWVKTQCTVGSANAIADPLGANTAERVTPDVGATNALIAQAINFDCAGKTFTFKVYLKAASGTPTISIHIINQGATARGTTVCNLTTTWTEYSVTGTMDAADTGVICAVGGFNTWVVAEGAIDMWGAGFGGDSDCELKKVLADANSDGSGGINAVDIFPRIHADLPPYSRIITSNPRGVFRLTDNKMEWDYDRLKMYGLNFTAAEVL